MGAAKYTPPYTLTSRIVTLVERIGESIGQLAFDDPATLVPQLRRSNRIRTIHASLAIENNTLSVEQITAVVNGKRVLGKPGEIAEVRNAYSIYEQLETLNPYSRQDLLRAHRILMEHLVEKSGAYRTGSVGIMRGKDVVHLAPPAENIPSLMNDLLAWLKKTDAHPLIAGAVFHYEFEFIHPFSDGNGRMGRLWQTLILSRWKPMMAYLPVESVVHLKQKQYYHALGESDRQANATPFIEFMLEAIAQALDELVTDQVTDHETDHVRTLLALLQKQPLSAAELMKRLELSHRPTFRENYLHPALSRKLIEMTRPETPRSRLQKYRITELGRRARIRSNEETE